jgi:hypothetical protein
MELVITILEFIGLLFVTFLVNVFMLGSITNDNRRSEENKYKISMWFIFTIIFESVLIFITLLK